MLKKIVKYGNSSALVLDRAILELLNMKEGSMVKLHTDGKSLIVTPEHVNQTQEASMTGVEKIQNYNQECKDEALKVVEDEKLSSSPNYQLFQEAVQEIMRKHQKAYSGYDHQAFLSEIDTLSETKYKGDKISPEFIEEVKAIQARYSPGLAAAQQELADVAKKFGF